MHFHRSFQPDFAFVGSVDLVAGEGPQATFGSVLGLVSEMIPFSSVCLIVPRLEDFRSASVVIAHLSERSAEKLRHHGLHHPELVCCVAAVPAVSTGVAADSALRQERRFEPPSALPEADASALQSRFPAF